MSLYFDLVINTYFRESIQEDHVKVLHWLTDTEYMLDFIPSLTLNNPDDDLGNIWERIKYTPHLLATTPEHQRFVHLQRIHHTTIPAENNRKVYLWLLQYTGRWLHDDSFYESYIPCLYWLSSISKDGLLGYWRETDYPFATTHLLFAKNGNMESVDVNSPI